MRPTFMDRLGARLVATASDNLPAATVTSFEEVGNGIALVVVAHSFDGGRDGNRQALNKVLDGRAEAIAGSFRKLPGVVGTSRIVSAGYVKVNEIVEPLTAARQATMTEVAKNVLMDATDQTAWDIVESNGDRFIRRQKSEDISAVLSSVRQNKLDVVQASTLAYAAPSTRDYVCFVDTDTKALNYGYVVASEGENVAVLPRDASDLVTVSRSLIVAMATDVDTKDNFLKNTLDKVEASLPDKEKVKEYYRKVYYYDPNFLSKVEQTIDKQASL